MLGSMDSARSGVSWRQSFAVRFAIVWALVLGGAVGLSGWISYRDGRRQLLDGLQQTVGRDAGVIEVRVSAWLGGLGEDTRAASRSPVVREFIEAIDSPAEERWRSLVEDSFKAVFVGKPTYFQMRLLRLGGVGEGQEVLRLDRQGDELVVTPRDQLQQKADRDYFRESLSLPDGQIYFSTVSLNRDFGEITTPWRPTIRAATRIRTTSGREMMLIINADLGSLFAELKQLASSDSQIYLAQENGDFIFHPDKGAVFASDLGHERKSEDEQGKGLSETRVMSTGHWPERKLELEVALDDAVWRPVLTESRRRGIWITVLAAISGAALAVAIAWVFSRRLSRLSKALRMFDGRVDSEENESLSDGRSDEIGVTLERFERMAGKVRAYVKELDGARHEAEEANAAKDVFLAVMSHEIRTPLNAVVGLVRALEANDPTERQRPLLNSLRSSVENLVILLNTALDYTRLREEVMEFAVEPFDAAQLAIEVSESLRPLALGKGLSLDCHVPESLWVRGDAVRLRQVLNNLLNNALKFTEKGGVGLTLRYDQGRLSGEVSDTGPGVPKVDRDKVFEPFYSRAKSVSGVGPGVGLGLSVSRELIEQQGGRLALVPGEGRGAVFRFELPVPGHTPMVSQAREQSAPFHLTDRSVRILYVEDTPSNQEVMALTLEETGVKLVCVANGKEALGICQREAFDLVMLDLQLPDIDGRKLAGELRRELPEIPMVLVTAQTNLGSDEGRNGEIDEVIFKPYTRDRVIQVLDRYLKPDFHEVLRKIHPEDSKKAARLAARMAEEFREAALTLKNVEESGFEEAVRECRHRMTSALDRFSVKRLELALKPGNAFSQKEELVSALSEAAESLEKFHE